MENLKTAREMGFIIGDLPTGPLNLISDVPGVTVGHKTVKKGDIRTGVTAVLPHGGNLFRHKVLAASHVINGFGKSMGLIQINELGTLETPILMTNTLSIGTAANGLIRYMLEQNTDIGKTTGTVNPVVTECNDGFLNDIRGMHVTQAHVRHAIDTATRQFAQGAVGAGTGMRAFELKGGIGSASCCLDIQGNSYTVGALVLSNMGKIGDLMVCGDPVGKRIKKRQAAEKDPVPDGSIIVILATDIPLCERQLLRISKRALVGLSCTGSKVETGSGEIVIAFSTANTIPHYEESSVETIQRVPEGRMSQVFRAVAQSTQEAVLNSLFMSETTKGIDGHTAVSLSEYLAELKR